MKKIFKKLKRFALRNFSNKGKQKIKIINKGNFIKCSFKNFGKDNLIELGKNNNFNNCKFYVAGNNNKFSFGNNNNFKDVEFYIEDNNNCITIGNNNKFCGQCQLACIEGTQISFGDNCLISSNVHIVTGDSHSILENGKRTNLSKNITIKDHVWIGRNVCILKGSIINENSVIGMNSLVNKEFSKCNVVIAGNPAKIVKESIDWDNKRI